MHVTADEVVQTVQFSVFCSATKTPSMPVDRSEYAAVPQCHIVQPAEYKCSWSLACSCWSGRRDSDGSVTGSVSRGSHQVAACKMWVLHSRQKGVKHGMSTEGRDVREIRAVRRVPGTALIEDRTERRTTEARQRGKQQAVW
jgi:hypothetical protein